MARKMLGDGELRQEEGHFDFDSFVIGAGSGAIRAARFSANYGAKGLETDLVTNTNDLHQLPWIGSNNLDLRDFDELEVLITWFLCLVLEILERGFKAAKCQSFRLQSCVSK
ncbi:hypothetical protein PTKIN_Ptkin17bG0055200 [Pterospermum kingtungense]